MKFLTSSITIIVELVILALSIIWYATDREIEPMIGIIASSGGLIAGLLTKFAARPRIVLHRRETHLGRSPQGYTPNNPPVIRVGIDKPDMYWKLDWNYVLEIRNNSTHTAYNLQIEYRNIPEKTFVVGEIGKIEPIQPHELREFNIKIVQNVSGTHVDADKYMEENPNVLTKDFVIEIKYKDEAGIRFRSRYNWLKDESRHLIL